MVIGNLTTLVRKIYGAGGRKFGFLNLGELGCYPGLRLLKPHQSRSSCLQQEVSVMAKLHNQKLLESLSRMEQELPGFKFSVYDFNRALEVGDANTHFFHLTTTIHERYNAINRVLNFNNTWLCDRLTIGNEFEAYFSNLFTSVCPSYPDQLQGLITARITAEMNDQLTVLPTYGEIQHAIFSMGNYKSPGPNGRSVTFYKHYWGTVRLAVVSEIQHVFSTCTLQPALNHTFLALISKSTSAHKVDQFMPIALCNVAFKAITKIIAGRLRHILGHIVAASGEQFAVPLKHVDGS